MSLLFRLVVLSSKQALIAVNCLLRKGGHEVLSFCLAGRKGVVSATQKVYGRNKEATKQTPHEHTNTHTHAHNKTKRVISTARPLGTRFGDSTEKAENWAFERFKRAYTTRTRKESRESSQDCDLRGAVSDSLPAELGQAFAKLAVRSSRKNPLNCVIKSKKKKREHLNAHFFSCCLKNGPSTQCCRSRGSDRQLCLRRVCFRKRAFPLLRPRSLLETPKQEKFIYVY